MYEKVTIKSESWSIGDLLGSNPNKAILQLKGLQSACKTVMPPFL